MACFQSIAFVPPSYEGRSDSLRPDQLTGSQQYVSFYRDRLPLFARLCR
jgi:hypothetical protein